MKKWSIFNMSIYHHEKIKLLFLFVTIIILNACSNINQIKLETVKPLMAHYEINESELLNVSISLFDAGKISNTNNKHFGISQEIRNAEARYIPMHLKYTMQRSGYWGNVRVVPGGNEFNDVLVKGKIVLSDGENLELEIQVIDASNYQWFEKKYKETVIFNQNTNTEPEKNDRFQNLYHQISNDIIEYRLKLKHDQINRIKNLAELRFANYMAPVVFNSYINKDKTGKFQLLKLPSKEDSMLKRVHSIRVRNEMLIDTINNYYDMYYSDMWDSYNNWRKFRSEELNSIREIENKALTRKVLGAAAVIGAIALGASHNADVVDRTGVLRTVMIAGGTYAVYDGIKISKESEINKAAIEELGTSFENDVEPIIMNVQGKTMKLNGSADQQYRMWQDLLKNIYIEETAL